MPRSWAASTRSRVAVIGVEIGALLEGGIEPQAGDAQAFEVVELGEDAPQGAAAELQPGAHPSGLVVHAKPLGVGAIKQGPFLLAAIAEAIGKDLVEHVVAPEHRAGKHPPAGPQIQVVHILWGVHLDGGGHGAAAIAVGLLSSSPRARLQLLVCPLPG